MTYVIIRVQKVQEYKSPQNGPKGKSPVQVERKEFSENAESSNNPTAVQNPVTRENICLPKETWVMTITCLANGNC